MRSLIEKRDLIAQINSYMFNKKESVIVVPSETKYNSQFEQIKLIAALYQNLHDLGYEIANVEPLFDLSEEQLKTEIYEPLLKEAKAAKGANVEHRLLFPNFPESVKAVDLETLSNIRFASYFTTAFDTFFEQDALADGSITREFVNGIMKRAMENANITQDKVPELLKKENEKKNIRTIKIVTENEYFDMVKKMLSARTSLSSYDKEIVKFTIDNFVQDMYMPTKIQFRETQAMLDKYNFEHRYLHNINVRSFQDFERLLVSLSDGDTSLSSKQIVRNFSNQERKKLFEIFKDAVKNNYPIMLETAANRQSLRFADNVLKGRLHFNEMKEGEIYRNFIKQVKNKESIMGIYERNMREGRYATAATVLSRHSSTLLVQHAKELIAKAYAAYEKSQNDNNKKDVKQIIETLAECSKRTDIKTLMNLEKEIEKPNLPYRIMMPKGQKSDLVVKENKSVKFPYELADITRKAIYKGIAFQLQNYEMEGKVQIKEGTKVYIDENLKDCPIPTVGRSDSGKNRTVAPGTKLPVQECDILRAALYKQNDHNQFIDFSAGFFDENYNMVGQVSWNNLTESKNGKLISYHSGDTSACSGKGCTEVIDIDLNVAKENFKDARYVAYMAVMWNGTKISSCNQLFMTLSPTNEIGKNNGQKIDKSGKVFDPADVQFKVDVVGDKRATIPMLYDMKEHKAIVVNIESKAQDMRTATFNKRHFDLPIGCECLENYHSDTALKLFAYENMDVPTIHDLASLYALYKKANIVESPDKADVIFAIDRMQVEDKREKLVDAEQEVEQDVLEQVVITPFDKDIITAELIPDPKQIGDEIGPIEREIILEKTEEKSVEIDEREL